MREKAKAIRHKHLSVECVTTIDKHGLCPLINLKSIVVKLERERGKGSRVKILKERVMVDFDIFS